VAFAECKFCSRMRLEDSMCRCVEREIQTLCVQRDNHGAKEWVTGIANQVSASYRRTTTTSSSSGDCGVLLIDDPTRLRMKACEWPFPSQRLPNAGREAWGGLGKGIDLTESASDFICTWPRAEGAFPPCVSGRAKPRDFSEARLLLLPL
jgi:hypothetical protein